VLQDALVEMEVRRSLFEREVRKRELHECATFPLRFKEIDGILVADGKLERIQPKRVAVLFSGGPAAGGHNVIAGLKRGLHGSTLLGVREGFKGLLANNFFEITDISDITNTGGFDFLGTSRVKIKDRVQETAHLCKENNIDALVIIGGDDSATNAALLAPHMQVVSVPKTMDGDLQHGNLLPIPFGFDTATKTYAEAVGNILQDTRSSLKYWHFVKLMGRSASHVTLEVALQTKPTITLISEEGRSLNDIVEMIAQAVIARDKAGKNYGLVLVPEGLLEFIPEMNHLILEIDEFMGRHLGTLELLTGTARKNFIRINLEQYALFDFLPGYIQDMLIADRDAHGNLTVSQIETERLLSELVAKRVQELAPSVKFAVNHHFFGYEGRCGAPSAFDAMLGYNLGLTAASLVLDNRSGYMASISRLDQGGIPLAIPLSRMIREEEREGVMESVVEKALLRTDSPAYKFFLSRRNIWMQEDRFSSPGPRQLWGPSKNQMPISVALNQGYASLEFLRE
jgi:diphosphate-dependent phosphofructokinase